MAKDIFASTPLMAEATWLRETISLAYALSIPKVILESDCQTLIEACWGNVS